jgi:uncharacterized protein (DUF1501 family)
MTTRRNLLKVGLGSLPVICLGGTMPAFVSRMAMADPATRPSVSNDNILVVVQLSGGNDGLNTVIPFKADPYYKARPVLGLKQNLLKLNDEHALHPAMGAFKRLYDDGKLAIVNGCGYPKPNRSHFESMAIWHAGDPANAGANGGWVGHYLDHLRRGTSSASAGNVMQAINIGSELPQALVNADAPAPSIQSFEDFSVRLLGRANGTEKLERTLIEEVNRINDASPTLAFLSRQATNAIISTDQIIKIAGGYQSAVEYPAGLGQRLRLIAQIINGNFGTRIFYCEIGGFDTHASQLQQHDNLMRQVSDSISAFTADMAAKGYGDKVTVMCFSEFGRRVQQNDSNGTDHGAAGPMFLVGGKVKGGLHGAMPSLEKEKLDDGDLRYTTDFRRVYATLLDQWLNTDSVAVLKNKFEPMALV